MRGQGRQQAVAASRRGGRGGWLQPRRLAAAAHLGRHFRRPTLDQSRRRPRPLHHTPQVLRSRCAAPPRLQVNVELGQKMQTQVFAPLQQWISNYNDAAAKQKVVDKLKAEVRWERWGAGSGRGAGRAAAGGRQAAGAGGRAAPAGSSSCCCSTCVPCGCGLQALVLAQPTRHPRLALAPAQMETRIKKVNALKVKLDATRAKGGEGNPKMADKVEEQTKVLQHKEAKLSSESGGVRVSGTAAGALGGRQG